MRPLDVAPCVGEELLAVRDDVLDAPLEQAVDLDGERFYVKTRCVPFTRALVSRRLRSLPLFAGREPYGEALRVVGGRARNKRRCGACA